MQEIILEDDKMAFRTREAYKTLRSNIEFSGNDIKVIAITSCTPNEGKSEVSFQLARSFAQNHKKVLLIDADMRKSVMRVHFKSGKVHFGLSNYLVKRCQLSEAICKTDEAGFNMVFSGPVPPNPSELLNNTQFHEMLAKTRDIYDYIIIDTPPLGSVIDSAVISTQCDGAIIVLESGAISYHFAQKVEDQLKKADCKILGCVLNKVELGGGKGYYGKYYGKYYGTYGSEEQEDDSLNEEE